MRQSVKLLLVAFSLVLVAAYPLNNFVYAMNLSSSTVMTTEGEIFGDKSAGEGIIDESVDLEIFPSNDNDIIKEDVLNEEQNRISFLETLDSSLKSEISSNLTFIQDTKYFQVMEPNVTVYDNSTGKLVPIGKLSQGAVFPFNKISGNWIEIQFSDKKGYIWRPAAIPSKTPPKKIGDIKLQQNQYITSLQELPVYDNSTGKLIEIGRIAKGIKYKVIRQTGDWMEILFSGRIAYVYKTGYEITDNGNSKSTPSFTSETRYFQVMEPNVTVYDNSTGKLVPIGKLSQGAVFPFNKISGNWIEIQFSDKKGYIWKPAATPSKTPPKKIGDIKLQQNQYITSLQELPVYDNSTGKLIEIGRIAKGIEYKVIRQTGDWMEILFSGRIAYVYKTGYKLPFDKNSKNFIALQDNITVYDNSTGTLVPVGMLAKGQIYPIGKITGNWIEIQFANKKGYIWKDATAPTSIIPKKTGQTALLKEIYFKAIQELPVYDNSTGKLVQIGNIKKGVQYPIIRQSGNWIEILFAGRISYVYITGIELLFSDAVKYFVPSQQNVDIVENINGELVKVGRLVQGQTYERVSDYGNWHKIKFGDRSGLVLKDETKPVLSANFKNPANGIGSDMLQLKMNATVYDNTSGSLVPFATLEKDATISYISRSGNWYKVSLLGREGYVYADAAEVIAKDIVNPFQTYTYTQMEKDILELVRMYPDLISVEVIGQSVDDRNLYAIKLGKGDTEIFFNGAHHAREHITTNLLMEMIDTYAKAYVKNQNIDGYNTRDILDKTSIWFVPMVNPDGVTLVQLGHTSAKNPDYVLKLNNNSKDFNAWKANIRGVDLNRQYPADWDKVKGNTGKPGPKNYKGPRPLSEPETKALYDFTLAHDFKTAVAYHSTGEVLYWNYHQDSVRYKRDLAIAEMIKQKTGYKLVYPGSNPSSGGYTDWFIKTQLKPGFTPEVAPYLYETQVPISYFPRIWSQNYSVGLMLAEEAYKNRNNR